MENKKENAQEVSTQEQHKDNFLTLILSMLGIFLGIIGLIF